MKLNVAAGINRTNCRGSIAGITFLSLALVLLFSSGSASALDGIDLSNPPEASDAGGCSRLVKIKYPFLPCTDGEIGLADGDHTWENSRRIPRQGSWVESNGAWGPDLNLE